MKEKTSDPQWVRVGTSGRTRPAFKPTPDLLMPRHRELELWVPLLSPRWLLDLLEKGLCPELELVGLQGSAHRRLHIQQQVLLFLVIHGPVGQTLTVGVPVDMSPQAGSCESHSDPY